LIFIKIILFFI